MSQLQIEAQSLNPSAIISLFELDCTRIGGSVYRFCAESNPDGTPVSFGGVFYQQIGIKQEGFEWNSDGTYPRPKLSVSTLNDTFYSIVVATNGGQGAILTRTRTLAKFLDGQEMGGQGIHFPVDIYIVDRVLSLSKSLVEFELIAPLDLPRCQVPSRTALRDLCPWVYRTYVNGRFEYDQTSNACPYTGTKCFDKYGHECGVSEDSCGRRVSDCVKRFGGYKDLPFGGFPGLARNRA